MDFALALFIALIVSGAIIYWDRFFGAQRRASRAGADSTAKLPWLVEYSRAFFPVILVVFLLRSFVVEPFRIPSGSMLPSLYIGDFILVSKFQYGIRLPIINTRVIPIAEPERGDVMVFRFPRDSATNFIKRVIGIPGDVVTYRGKRLAINGHPVTTEKTDLTSWSDSNQPTDQMVGFFETIDDSVHTILTDGRRQGRSIRVVVPPGQYFVMGDNRDHSNDSRYWGFVPESHIVGKAFFVWFSWDTPGGGGVNWGRLGTVIH